MSWPHGPVVCWWVEAGIPFGQVTGCWFHSARADALHESLTKAHFFECLVDVAPPDATQRAAILHARAHVRRLSVAADVAWPYVFRFFWGLLLPPTDGRYLVLGNWLGCWKGLAAKTLTSFWSGPCTWCVPHGMCGDTRPSPPVLLGCSNTCETGQPPPPGRRSRWRT